MRKYWRIRGDFIDYITPIEGGEIFHPPELLQEGFEFNPENLKLHFMRRGKKETRIRGNFTAWRQGVITLDKATFEIMRNFITPSARCFDVDISKHRYVICLIDNKLDAFDRARSRFRIYGDDCDVTGYANTIPPGSDVRIRRIFFKPDFQTDTHVFRLAGELPLQMEVIVSDEFYQAYHDHNMTGLIFQSVGQ